MKTLIYFNATDTPEGVGQSQMLEGTVEDFIQVNQSKFIEPIIENDMLTFTKLITESEVIKGYAMIFQVPNDFQN